MQTQRHGWGWLLVVLVLVLLGGAGCRTAVQQTDIVSGGGGAGDGAAGAGVPVLWQGADGETVTGMWFGQCDADGACLVVTTEQTIVAIQETALVKLPPAGAGAAVNVTNVQTVSQGKSFPMSILNPNAAVSTDPETAQGVMRIVMPAGAVVDALSDPGGVPEPEGATPDSGGSVE